jgi:hypothetical protein
VQWAAFIRNVMLGREGLDRLGLLELARAAGAEDVRSHITTGNLTFAADAEAADAIVERLEAGVARMIGREEMVALRPFDWVQELVRSDPFAGFDRGSWITEVALLRHDAPPLRPDLLPDPQRTVVVAVLEREVLSARPAEGGRRPHVNRLTELAAGSPATSRGWSTLARIAAL